jgi:hypothetical protein
MTESMVYQPSKLLVVCVDRPGLRLGTPKQYGHRNLKS